MNKRGGTALTSIEKDVFGIDFTKGWRERYKDLEITPSQIHRVCSKTARSEKVSSKNKCRIQAMLDIEVTNEKLLYFMVSSGKCKIGISKNPKKRARTLTTSSGTLVELVCVWDVKLPASVVEAHLLNYFKAHRLEGEWFHLGKFSYVDIENNMNCAFERKFLCEEAFNTPIDFPLPAKDYCTKLVAYKEIKLETTKAVLIDYFGQDVWIGKSTILEDDRESQTMLVKGFVKIPTLEV